MEPSETLGMCATLLCLQATMLLMAEPNVELELVRKLDGPQTVVEWVGFVGDNEEEVAAAGQAGIVVWNRESGKQVRHFGDPVRRAALSPDRKVLYAGVGPEVVAYDLNTGKVVSRFRVDEGEISAIAVSNDGKYVVAGNAFRSRMDRGNKVPKIVLWEVATGKKVREYHGHNQDILVIAWLPGSDRFLSHATAGSWRLWSAAAADCVSVLGEEVTSYDLSGRNARVYTSFNADGSLALSNGELMSSDPLKKISDWKMTEDPPPRLSGTSHAAVFLRKDQLIATGHEAGDVCIWNAKSGKLVTFRLANDNTAPIYAIALSSDERYLLTGGLHDLPGFIALQRRVPAIDRHVRLWKIVDKP